MLSYVWQSVKHELMLYTWHLKTKSLLDKPFVLYKFAENAGTTTSCKQGRYSVVKLSKRAKKLSLQKSIILQKICGRKCIDDSIDRFQIYAIYVTWQQSVESRHWKRILSLHYTSTTEILFSYQQGLRKINQSITSAKKYIRLEYRETATAISRKKKRIQEGPKIKSRNEKSWTFFALKMTYMHELYTASR